LVAPTGLSLPIAFLSLVPSGTVSAGLFHTIEFIRALFPFHAALNALSAGLEMRSAAALVGALAIVISGLSLFGARRIEPGKIVR